MTFSPLKSNALGGRQFARYEWSAVVPNDTLLSDILKPAWWVHWADTLKARQVVEIMTEDGLLDIELRVARVADGLVHVRPLRVFEDTEARAHLQTVRAAAAAEKAKDAETEMPDGYKAGFSPKSGYFVVLRATGKTIKTGLESKAKAAEYAAEHAKQAGLANAA